MQSQQECIIKELGTLTKISQYQKIIIQNSEKLRIFFNGNICRFQVNIMKKKLNLKEIHNFLNPTKGGEMKF
jgi:hypothetical protein